MAIKQEIERKEKRTCLYDKHLSLGAMMVSFGGFDMPLLYQYAGIAPNIWPSVSMQVCSMSATWAR